MKKRREPFFLKHAMSLLYNGYEPLPATGKKVWVKRWSKRPITTQWLAQLMHRHQFDNVSIRTGKVIAIDIDYGTRKDVARVRALVHQILGPTRFLRVGRPPRGMLFYRCSGHVRSRKFGKVEIHGHRRQVVVFGIHPKTGRRYRWPEDSIEHTPVDQLPLVTDADVNRLEQALGGHGPAHQPLTPAKASPAAGKAVSGHLGTGNTLRQLAGPSTGLRVPLRVGTRLPNVGERNDWLFHHLLVAARTLPIPEITVEAHALNNLIPVPLDAQEVNATARSVCRYKREGSLRGSEAYRERSLSADIPAPKRLSFNARRLYRLLRVTRWYRPFEVTVISTAASLGWTKHELTKALSELLKRQILIRVGSRPSPPPRKAAYLYDFLWQPSVAASRTRASATAASRAPPQKNVICPEDSVRAIHTD